ncbi:MAG TPA: energy transducer TonB [Candidatus Sulfopaludibacter sp.]|jgi:TonB family protein|nr:energy transducer TonB [Candidatus Sulfopaludibacter sp.]
MYLIGDIGQEERLHAGQCAACQARIARLAGSLSHFRGAVRTWSDQTRARDRAAELRWTVIPASDHLERMLLPATVDAPWYRSFWSNLRDFLAPAPPPLDITAKPVLVRDIWGQYGRQKKSWMMSVGLQTAAVLLLFTAASTKVVQHKMTLVIPLIAPDLADFQVKPAPHTAAGGGGGGDRSLLAANKGRLPKAALRQFVPPQAVVANLDARMTMEPSILAPPDVILPQVNMPNYGDPLGKLGPPSNGTGSGGGIGSGKGGGVGSGTGGGVGAGEGGGFGGGVFRVGGGVTAPALIQKVEPEYSEEARKAKYQGVVTLYVEVDPAGKAVHIRVMHGLGLGLDEKAIEAVKKWVFLPGKKDGRPVTVAATIEVNFRLL